MASNVEIFSETVMCLKQAVDYVVLSVQEEIIMESAIVNWTNKNNMFGMTSSQNSQQMTQQQGIIEKSKTDNNKLCLDFDFEVFYLIILRI